MDGNGSRYGSSVHSESPFEDLRMPYMNFNVPESKEVAQVALKLMQSRETAQESPQTTSSRHAKILPPLFALVSHTPEVLPDVPQLIIEKSRALAPTAIQFLVESCGLTAEERAHVEQGLTKEVSIELRGRLTRYIGRASELWNRIAHSGEALPFNSERRAITQTLAEVTRELDVPFQIKTIGCDKGSSPDLLNKSAKLSNSKFPEFLCQRPGEVKTSEMFRAIKGIIAEEAAALRARDATLRDQVQRYISAASPGTLTIVITGAAHRDITRGSDSSAIKIHKSISNSVQNALPEEVRAIDIPTLWDRKLLKQMAGLELTDADAAKALLARMLTLVLMKREQRKLIAELASPVPKQSKEELRFVLASAIVESMRGDCALAIIRNACDERNYLTTMGSHPPDFGTSLTSHLKAFLEKNVAKNRAAS